MHACKASTELKSMDAIVSVCARCVLRKQTEPWVASCMHGPAKDPVIMGSPIWSCPDAAGAPSVPYSQLVRNSWQAKALNRVPFFGVLNFILWFVLGNYGETLIIYLYILGLSKKYLYCHMFDLMQNAIAELCHVATLHAW